MKWHHSAAFILLLSHLASGRDVSVTAKLEQAGTSDPLCEAFVFHSRNGKQLDFLDSVVSIDEVDDALKLAKSAVEIPSTSIADRLLDLSLELRQHRGVCSEFYKRAVEDGGDLVEKGASSFVVAQRGMCRVVVDSPENLKDEVFDELFSSEDCYEPVDSENEDVETDRDNVEVNEESEVGRVCSYSPFFNEEKVATMPLGESLDTQDEAISIFLYGQANLLGIWLNPLSDLVKRNEKIRVIVRPTSLVSVRINYEHIFFHHHSFCGSELIFFSSYKW